jgi:hypothetical protein
MVGAQVMYDYIFRRLIKGFIKKAAHQILQGRLIDRGHPESGRFLKHDVDSILKEVWRGTADLIPEAHMERIPTKGNRQNVFLAILTIAAYHSFLKARIEKDYAIELFSDIGWKVYCKFLVLPKLVARIITRDPQKRVNLILRMFMYYPFSTPGRPGYECRAWADEEGYCTFWTHCPPYEFVRRYIEKHNDRGELAAFQRSWCWYDWSLTYAMVDGAHNMLGQYERPHTLSYGDDICDMRWSARVKSNQKGTLS